jgi:hypothetical protein
MGKREHDPAQPRKTTRTTLKQSLMITETFLDADKVVREQGKADKKINFDWY